MENVEREMPVYKCHKEVWALKIDAIGIDETDQYTITPAEKGYASFKVSGEFMKKHNPKVGGYYVVYEDGYKSFSPAEAFEEGYTPK